MTSVQPILRQLGAVRRCTQLSLRGQCATVSLVLTLSVNPDLQNRVGVKAQLTPLSKLLCLPRSLHFRLWCKNKLLQDLTPQGAMRCLEIPYFRGDLGETFRLEVQLDDDMYRAYFQI